MAKKRRFEFEVTCRIELTTRITVSATSEEEGEELAQAMIARGEAGFDKITVQCPEDWDFVGEETEVDLVEEVE